MKPDSHWSQYRVRKPAIARITVDYRSVTNGQFDVAIARDRMALRRIEIEIKRFPGPIRFFPLTRY